MKNILLSALFTFICLANTANAAGQLTVNGKTVLPVAGHDDIYLYYNPQTNTTEPLPENAIGFKPVLNSEQLFSTVIQTPKGLRYKTKLASGLESQLCKDIQLQTHYDLGPKFNVIICLTETEEWIPLEIHQKNGTITSPPAVLPHKNYRQLITNINEVFKTMKSEEYMVQKEAECMKLFAANRENCFMGAGSEILVRYLLKTNNPDPITLIQALGPRFFVPVEHKKILLEKFVALAKERNDLGSHPLSFVLQNAPLSEADRKLISEKRFQAQLSEIESAKNALRHCIKTANTWASIRERACAKQLGGEEWLAWLEQDLNAPSSEFAAAIAEAQKIGRDTSKLQKTYEYVKRAEADAEYYRQKQRREQEEKAAFGNIYTIMKNLRESITAGCGVTTRCANPNMDAYNLIQWEQSIKKGGPTWDQLRQ